MAAALQHIRPTLIVWGDRDRILPPHHLDAARQLLPHARTHLFSGIGHAPQIECPEEFADLVLSFLADAAASDEQLARATGETSVSACAPSQFVRDSSEPAPQPLP